MLNKKSTAITLSVGTADNAPSYDIVDALGYNVMSSGGTYRMMKKDKVTHNHHV